VIVVDASAALSALLNAGPARRTLASEQLRDALSAYDASYLAELLGCSLLTAHARLSRSPGFRCAITVVPG
jgi:predicted nucleic acid-binding protein